MIEELGGESFIDRILFVENAQSACQIVCLNAFAEDFFGYAIETAADGFHTAASKVDSIG